ncbi:MFS transporter [Streptomyces diastatochromogenes]|nr:MFS transporter [Streptomyces diastatochromogenes]
MTDAGTRTAPVHRRAVRTVPAGAVIASVALVELSSGMTQGFLSPLLKSLTDTLQVTAADLNWISIANLLASVAFTPVLSRMGDLYGHRRLLRWNLAIVIAGSVLVGLSRSFRCCSPARSSRAPSRASSRCSSASSATAPTAATPRAAGASAAWSPR